MPITMPDCDVVSRLPAGLTNAICTRCAKNLAGGPGPRRWIYCDRREQQEHDEEQRTGSAPGNRGKATADLIEGLGRYTIGRELGRGGMGLVLAAHDTVLNREVALKVQISGPSASDTARKRFAQELNTLAALQVDGVARVLDGGVTRDGMTWYVMERVDGPDLSEVLLDAFVLPRDEALRVVQTLARTMSRVHQNNIAHRDIKPSNILLTLEGDPVLVDFGLVTTLQRIDPARERLTVDVVGTPQYMAPEQHASDWESIDWVRVDVYALGMVLIECLTGALPPVAYPTLELLPADVRWVCEKATHTDPRRRYQTPAELAEAIEAIRRGGWRPSANTMRWVAGIAGAATLALALPTATLWSGYRADQAREAVATQRLVATWERIDGLNPNDPDVEATFRAFIDDASNHGTQAYHRAWRRRAEVSVDPDNQIESWATAWLTASDNEDRNQSLKGLVESFLAHGRWPALDALLVDTSDAELHDAGLNGPDLRIKVAIYARRFDEALALMPPDDHRRAMAMHFRTATRVPDLDDVLLVRPNHGWICGPNACFHPDGQTIQGPIDVNFDGGHLGPLFHRRDQGLFRPDGSMLCEIDLPHVLDGTEWNGQLVLAIVDEVPSVVLVDPNSCDITPFPIANSGIDTWVTAIHAVDLDGDQAEELVVGLGPSFGYGLRAISSDGQRVLADKTLGNVRDFVPIQDAGGTRFVVALSDFHISPYFFPNRAPSGVAIVQWAGDGFSEPKMLSHRLANSFDTWLADAGDVDGDGDLDISATHTIGAGSLTLWLNNNGVFEPTYIGQLSSVFIRQLDDDPGAELVSTASGEGWILGLGDDPIPSDAPPVPMPTDTRPVFAQALRLRRLGLLRRSAEEAERAARTLAFADAIDAWELAAQSWMDAGEPALAAQAYSEAARLGGQDFDRRALDAYVDGWALADAREFAIRAGLTSRAPTDYFKLDFSQAPAEHVWLADGVAEWSAPRNGILVDGINGLEDVIQVQTDRRSDLFGARVQLVSERLEWGAGVSLVIRNPDNGHTAEIRLDAHGGDGEMYRRISSSFHARSVPDTDPLGSHPTTLMLGYDRQQGTLYAEGWMGDERMVSHEKHFPFEGNQLIVSVRLPHHPQVSGAATRSVVKSIELFGLVPTEQPPNTSVRSSQEEDAYQLLSIRREPPQTDKALAEGQLDDVVRVFRSQLAMHPMDPELIAIADSSLDVLGSDAAIDEYPFAAVLYADALVASGRTDDAEAIYRSAVDAPNAHASALAWAGLADTASIRGQDPSPYVDTALAKAPSDNIGRAWLRRRRLGDLID